MAYKRVNEDSLTAVADAIRSKTGGTNELVFPEEFVSEIQGITTGSEPVLGEATFYVNGTWIAADKGIDGYSVVTVAVDTTPSLTDLAVTPSEQLQTFAPGDGYDGFGSVTVGAIQTEEIAIRSNGTYTPSEGKYFSSVVVDIASGVDFGESESYTFASRSATQTGYTTSYTFAKSISVVDGEITLVGATTSTPSTLAHYQGYTGHYFQKSGVTYYIPEDSTFWQVTNSPSYGYTAVKGYVQVVTVAESGGGSSEVITDYVYTRPSSISETIEFTGLPGEPKMFAVYAINNFSTTTRRFVTSVVYVNSAFCGLIATGSTVAFSSGYTYQYSDGTLTLTSNSEDTGGVFRSSTTYRLAYAL